MERRGFLKSAGTGLAAGAAIAPVAAIAQDKKFRWKLQSANPAGTPHGGPHAPVGQRHVGDFGNIEAGADSTATFERTDSLVTLSGMNSVVGKAVVVHAGADDLQSQPSGNSGARVACGVIWMEGDMGLMQDTTMTDTTTTDTTGF